LRIDYPLPQSDIYFTPFNISVACILGNILVGKVVDGLPKGVPLRDEARRQAAIATTMADCVGRDEKEIADLSLEEGR